MFVALKHGVMERREVRSVLDFTLGGGSSSRVIC